MHIFKWQGKAARETCKRTCVGLVMLPAGHLGLAVACVQFERGLVLHGPRPGVGHAEGRVEDGVDVVGVPLVAASVRPAGAARWARSIACA